MNLKSYLPLLKAAFSEWLEDNSPRMGAALAYYTVFSLSPLLIIVIAVAGLVFGQEAAQGQVVAQLQGLLGQDTAKAIQEMIKNADKPSSGIIGSLAGLITLLVGATGLFGELHDALNTIWEVPPKEGRGLVGLIKDRFLSFTMVLGIGFLLLVSLTVSAALAAFGQFLNSILPSLTAVGHVLNFVVSFGVVTLLFAMIYKYLPDVEIAWNDVWTGAAATALLFTVGKFLIGFYLGNSGVASAYGAASSLAVLLVWVYYSAQIFLFGAEFTHVYAGKKGSQLVTERYKASARTEPRARSAETATEQRAEQSDVPRLQLPELLNRFYEQIRELLNSQVALFKSESKEEITAAGKRMVLVVSTALLAALGFALFSIGLPLSLNIYIGNLAVSFAAVGVIYLLAGSWAAVRSGRRLKH
jgi:membrane protein